MKQPSPTKAVKAWAVINKFDDFVCAMPTEFLCKRYVTVRGGERVIPVHIVPVTGEEE